METLETECSCYAFSSHFILLNAETAMPLFFQAICALQFVVMALW